MEKGIKISKLFNHKILYLLLFVSISCSSQKNEEEFVSKITDVEFLEVLKKIKKVEDYGLKNYRFTNLSKPKSGDSGKEFNELESKKYLGFPKDSLYDKEEFYNHDEDIRTYGKTVEIFPYSWIKAFISENLVTLFVAKSNGINDGDLDMYYLFVLDYSGHIIDKIILSKRMITYDGIRPNHFGFLDKTHFNRYIYDSKERIDENGKVIFDNFCIIEKHEIKSTGKIKLIEKIEVDLNDDKGLNYGRYLNLEYLPEDDPMRDFLR